MAATSAAVVVVAPAVPPMAQVTVDPSTASPGGAGTAVGIAGLVLGLGGLAVGSPALRRRRWEATGR